MPSAFSTNCSSSGVGSRRSIQSASAGMSSAGLELGADQAVGPRNEDVQHSRPLRMLLALVLRGGQIVDELNQLARAVGFAHIRRVLAVDDNQRHALDVITLCQLLGALQV